MFKRWIIGLIVLIGLLAALDIYFYQSYTEARDAYIASIVRVGEDPSFFEGVTYDSDLRLLQNQTMFNYELSMIATLGAFGLLVVSLLAWSVKQRKWVLLKSLPKVIFSKQHFEGMTFFKWSVLIIGIIIALAFLQIAGN